MKGSKRKYERKYERKCMCVYVLVGLSLSGWRSLGWNFQGWNLWDWNLRSADYSTKGIAILKQPVSDIKELMMNIGLFWQ